MLLRRICPTTLEIPDDIYEELFKTYPQFVPYLDILRTRASLDTVAWHALVGPPGSCGETPSVCREFVRSVLQPIATHRHRFDVDQYTKFESGRRDTSYLSTETLVNLNPNYWSIPTRQEVEEMIRSMGKEPERHINLQWGDPYPSRSVNQIKYRCSAAAVAIRFLESLSKDSRSSITSIILNEDRAAVAFAECHGLGLVPYCRENPRLRVERRVNMWRTVFQTTTGNDKSEICYVDETFLARDISISMAVWIVEALELNSAGMPPGSFALTFDGDWACSEMFQTVVQRDAAWQAAIDLCLDRKFLPPLPYHERRKDPRNFDGGADNGDCWRRDNRWYLFEAFPQAIRDIVDGNSIVKCNFALGEAWDVERLVEQNKEWSFADWKAGWYDREKETFEPDPPSPSWVQLRCENSWDARLPLVISEEPDLEHLEYLMGNEWPIFF
ncbi:hypothetical protein LX36DRAFT_663483 [Colletotrichum falcatum]|nr:hypothetical protein LX36DRAFT_663483 [Colletotrichum falcatum]